MIAAVGGPRQVPASVAEQVLAWAEGNPLFVEELTRSMLEEGTTAASPVPETVHAVIAARIDRLAPEDKRLLQVAAVIGREVPHAVLERATDLGDEALRDGLARLQAAELLIERGSRAVHTCGFKHALTQAAAYQGVPVAIRGALHLRVLEALVALGGPPRPETLPTLAEHAAAGGDWRRAQLYYREAGLHLLARDANREAARCLEAALTAFARQDPGEESEALGLGCDLRFEAVQALYRVGELTRVADLAREALQLAERLGDPARLTQVLAALTHMLSNEGRHAESMEAGARALALADAHGLTMMRIWTGIMVGRTCLALGRFADGIDHLRRVIEVIGEDGDARYAFRGSVRPSPSARTYLALCLARTGDLDGALDHAEAAMRVAEAGEGPMDRAWASYTLGRVHHARTDWERAIPLLERAAALCESEGLATYLPRVLSGLASAYAQSGRTAEAVPLLERALAAGRACNLAYGETLILCQLGTTCVEAGRLDEAEGNAAQALTLARERAERGEEAWALLLSGDVAARRAPPIVEEARIRYAEAIALGEALGMRPLVARARIALGALERQGGRIEEARRHLVIAAAEARAMGISAWQTRAEELAG
jgi:tetratricopeptide (TPR) repeat protein